MPNVEHGQSDSKHFSAAQSPDIIPKVLRILELLNFHQVELKSFAHRWIFPVGYITESRHFGVIKIEFCVGKLDFHKKS